MPNGWDELPDDDPVIVHKLNVYWAHRQIAEFEEAEHRARKWRMVRNLFSVTVILGTCLFVLHVLGAWHLSGWSK